ncbi:radical SAM protein, partial [bacterium]
QGRSEVVLTAIHLGLYGVGLDPVITLEDLLEKILHSGLPGRIRLSSIEPLEVTQGLLDLIALSKGKICSHLHIPLQSGSDRILGEMDRPYRREDFIRTVIRARKAIPDVGIGCDVICGFPGEQSSDFYQTEDLIRDLEIPFVHAFPYSPRPGTRAARMKDDVHHSIKKERVLRLRLIAQENQRNFLDGLVGKKLEVVPESRTGPSGRVLSLADNYARVLLPGDRKWEAGALVEVMCAGRMDDFLIAATDAGNI